MTKRFLLAYVIIAVVTSLIATTIFNFIISPKIDNDILWWIVLTTFAGLHCYLLFRWWCALLSAENFDTLFYDD